LTVDFITKLLLVAGKDIILVVCDRLSKMTHFVATTEEISAEELVSVKNAKSGLNFSYFLFSLLFLSQFIFLYSIFRIRVRVISMRSHCHTVGHIR